MAGRLVGTRVKRLREKRGWSQSELGAFLNMNSQQILRYEKEYTNPNSETVASLAYYLQTTTDYLMGFTEDDAPQLVNEELTSEERSLVVALRSGNHAEVIRLVALLTKQSG